MPREILLIETFSPASSDNCRKWRASTRRFTKLCRAWRKLLPIPRRFEAKGLRRYGFHGLSYAYLMEELARLGDPAATNGRVILAPSRQRRESGGRARRQKRGHQHGFHADGGIGNEHPHGRSGSRTGPYLARTEKMTTKQFNEMVNHKSGLLGVSETSSDMRDLLDHETQDVRAAEAVALFCYQAKKWIGAFAAALGGLETLVFAGGIGENAPVVRARICNGLGFLGVELEEEAKCGK